MAEWLTKRQFAIRLGITRTSVNYAIQRDRIHTTMRAGETRVNWHTEMVRYMKHCSPETLQRVKYHLEASNRKGESDKASARLYHRRGRSKKLIDENGETQSAETLLNKGLEEMTSGDAAELITVVKAKKAQLEYETAAGKLIEVEVVAEEQLDMAAKVKSAMLTIPDRVSTMLEGLKHTEIHNKLTKEIKHALTNLSQSLKCIEKLKES